MSILIKGMEMPQDCAMMLKIFPDGRVGVPVHLTWAGTMVMKDAEAVPVPPHRRLLKVLKTERECVSRDCNRDCGKCDLSLEQDEVLSAYDFLITLFAYPAEEGET